MLIFVHTCGCVTDIMPSSSDTGVSDTLDPMAVVSDDEIPSEREVYTSDTTSTDDDDFQPFALPDVGVEPADSLHAGDLPIAVIPAPIPLAAFPVLDMPLDVVPDDNIDLFEEDPPEADYEGGASIAADVIFPIAETPAEELPVGSPVPDSFESVASASLHDQGVQHHSPDTDPDMAMSAAPGPAHEFEFDHEVDGDFDPVFPPDFDPDQEIEFIHLDQPLEAPVAPIDPLFHIPADIDMDLVDPEPVMAPEPVVAPNPALEHDPAHDDTPAVAPLVDDIPIAGLPVVAPPVVDDPVVDASLPDPVPVLIDRAPFAAHIDPRYADTHNGWIDDDDDYPPFVLPVTPPVAPVSAPTDIPLFPHTPQTLIVLIFPLGSSRTYRHLVLERGHRGSRLFLLHPCCHHLFHLHLSFLMLHHLLHHLSYHRASHFYGLRPLSCLCLIRTTRTMLGTLQRTYLHL
ncbi:hypothetical protein HanHA89_Chr10g0398821 [Helianthus annuus]|nr:hypothetical protein HanHA89_Chr10g0398821 [Helianthus annuus]